MTVKEGVEGEVAVEEKVRLFTSKAAVYSPTKEPAMWSLMPTSFGTVSKLELPKEWDKIIELCRFYYGRDPIGATVINKMVEIGVTELHNKKGKCSDYEFEVFDSLKTELLEFLKSCSLEYLISGLVVVERDWADIKPSELGLSQRKVLSLPTNFWFRNPSTIEIKNSPIPNREIYLVKIPQEDIDFIKNKGKYADGTKDPKTWEVLKEQYPKFVEAVRGGKTKFVLEDVLALRRKVISSSPYPTPFLYPALEPMMHKRNLRKMDYAIASRVISAILLIKIGSDDFPLLEDDEDIVTDLQAQMRWRESPQNIDRVFQLFVNHTIEMEWIYPDTDALLSEEKFRSVNQDILFALGFPRVLIIGETERTGTSTTEFALMGPAETLQDMRDKLLAVVKTIYKEVLEKNPSLSSAPEPVFTPVRLHDPMKMGMVAKEAHDRGVISKTTYSLMINEDFMKELEYMVEEDNKRKELGLPEFPAVPYSSPAPSQEGGEE